MICKYCGQNKNDNEFEIAKKINGKIYRRLKCKTCKQVTQNQRKYSNRDWLAKFKSDKKCIKCGFDNPLALTFHHRDPTEKDYNIAEMSGLSLKKIKSEIDKCDILCSNCHMILEAIKRKVTN